MKVELLKAPDTDLDIVNAAMMITERMIIEAHRRGYRVSDDGQIISPTGRRRTLKLYGKQRYPTFAISWAGATISGVFGIPAHQFAAYCFFGCAAFDPGLVVRHKNSNCLDVSRSNIRLGTYSENEMDKPAAVRSRSASAARKAQGVRPFNAIFTADAVAVIRKQVSTGPRGTQASLAREHGVTRACISRIVRNLNYAG